MRSIVRFAVLAVVAGGLSCLASSASAQEVQVRHHYLGDGFGWERPYSSSRIPTPPYFAIHPPVYYSYPVPRTYGYTPWAYPSYVMTPELKAPMKPAMFENPHVQPESTPARQTGKTASAPIKAQRAERPLVIENPFIEQAKVAQR